jgi:hypothetical protein
VLGVSDRFMLSTWSRGMPTASPVRTCHAAGARGDGGGNRTPQKSDDAGHGRANLR